MKRVWIDLKYEENTKLVDEVSKVLNKEYENFDVEIIGISYYDKKLPKDYQIVDRGSRELLAICIDGKVTTYKEDLEKFEETMCS